MIAIIAVSDSIKTTVFTVASKRVAAVIRYELTKSNDCVNELGEQNVTYRTKQCNN